MNKQQFGLISRETREYVYRVSSLYIMNYPDVWAELISPTPKGKVAGYAFTKVAIQCVNKYWPRKLDINDYAFDQTDAVSKICEHLVIVCTPAYISKMFPSKPLTPIEIREFNSFLFYIGTNVLHRYYRKKRKILNNEQREADFSYSKDEGGEVLEGTPIDTYAVSEKFQADYEVLIGAEVDEAIKTNKGMISRRIKNKNKRLKQFYEDVYMSRVLSATGKLPKKMPVLALSTGALPAFVKANVDIITYIESFVDDLGKKLPTLFIPSLLFPVGLKQDFEIQVLNAENGKYKLKVTMLEEVPTSPNQ